MNKYINIQKIVMPLVFLAGCSTIPTSQPIPQITDTPQKSTLVSPSPSPLIEATISPTAAPTHLEPTKDINQPAENKITVNCINITKNPIPDNLGSLVIFVELDPPTVPIVKTGDYYLFDISNKTKTLIPVNWSKTLLVSPEVSPDGKKIAYRYGDKSNNDWLVIADKYGNEIKRLSWKSNWYMGVISGWWDNNALLIQTEPGNFSDQIIYSISTDKESLLPNSFDIYELWNPLSWGGASLIQFDPLLEKVIYPTYSGTDFGFRVELHEIKTGKLLSAFMGSEQNKPQWTNDGSFFVSSVLTIYDHGLLDNELYKIDRDGHQLLIFNAKTISDYAEVMDFSLSPDNKFVAFWLVDRQANDDAKKWTTQLMILDIEERILYQLCLERGYTSSFSGPVWSPNGKYLSAQIQSPDKDNQSELVLIDINKFIAYRTGNSGLPIGWVQ